MAVAILFCLSSISNVSATTYNATDHDNNAIIQTAISSGATDGVVEFQEGTYQNLGNLTINRDNLIIKGTGQVNIIGSNSDTLFTIASGKSNITIENLNITGYGYAIRSLGVTIDKLSILRCNISTYRACVVLEGSSFTDIVIENNIMFSENVTRSTYGVINIFTMNSQTSAISITIKGNNISATAYSNPTGLFFDMGTNSINTLIIEDNNINTPYSGIEIWEDILGPFPSTNNISLKNNTIKAGVEYGLWIFLESGDNHINIIDNRIDSTGTFASYAVVLWIVGNSNITFIGNNITAKSHGLQISYDGGSLYLYDNNFIATEVAVYLIYEDGIPISEIDVLIIGNTIISEEIAFLVRTYDLDKDIFTSDFNVNFNQIISPIGLCVFYVGDPRNPIGTISLGDYASSSFDYNWWGANDISDKLIGFKTNNHYILSITPLDSLKDLKEGDTVRFALLVLNDSSIDDADGVKNMPFFTIEGTFGGEPFSTDRDNSFVYKTPKLTEGKHLIETSISVLNPSNFDIKIRGTSKVSGAFIYNGQFNLAIDELLEVYPLDISKKEDSEGSEDKKSIDGNNSEKEDSEDKEPLGGNNSEEDTTHNQGLEKENNENNPDSNSLGSETGNSEVNPSGSSKENQDSLTDTPTGHASMKNTGLPIAILLVISLLSMVVYRRK